MDQQYPVYTVQNECQDCYKCVRHCPVKAIRVEKGRANVVPKLCIACGRCVRVCPAKAKKVRDDLGRAKNLLTRKSSVYISLAPSWVSEFPEVSRAQMIAALKRLGATGVGETAIGAQEVSATIAKQLQDGQRKLLLSSACPVAVSYVQKYMPHLTDSITAVLSPLLAHCKLLRRAFGDDIGIIFIGPCIAKKEEADQHPELLDIALTFEDLRRWLHESAITPQGLTIDNEEEQVFVPESAQEGAIYPIEGGMNRTIQPYQGLKGVEFITLSGIDNIESELSDIDLNEPAPTTFIECLACEGGCVNGPGTSTRNKRFKGRLNVMTHTEMPAGELRRRPQVEILQTYAPAAIEPKVNTEDEIRQALLSVGKSSKQDELNCGGCGYNTCREFARALLAGKAETSMCVSYMRQQAMNKANALLRCMPCGGVIVDENLKIIECNQAFARIFDEGTMLAFDACPGLHGAVLDKILPFSELFVSALQSGQDIQREHMLVGDRLLNVMIFTIEAHHIIGAIIEDVTQSELKREQIAQKAREVIERNVSTVQDIACKLGEHMADTEILLRSIASDYGNKKANGKPKGLPK